MTVQASAPTEWVWAQKYRPNRVADCILPEELKAMFQGMVDSGNITNMVLAGPAGTGKTTIATAMCEELNADYLLINASLDMNMDKLRTDVSRFASAISLTGGRKVVILDEADAISPLVQQSLRAFIESFSKNATFVLTCNFKNKLIEPLYSRCPVIDFKIPLAEKPKLAATFMKRAMHILDQESVAYDPKAVAALISKYFPDWRGCLNQLQKHSAAGKIDSSILADLNDESFKALADLVKAKKWKDVRKWVSDNIDNEPTAIMRKFYDAAFDIIKPSSIPALVLLIADYSYKASFVSDSEISLMAFLTQVMSEVEFL